MIVTVISFSIAFTAFAVGHMVDPFITPSYSNPVFNPPLNWADVVQGICGLALWPAIIVAGISFLWSFV